jgi:hypothetical protein
MFMLKHEHILEEEQGVVSSEDHNHLEGFFLEEGESQQDMQKMLETWDEGPGGQEQKAELGWVEDDGTKVSVMSFVPGVLLQADAEEDEASLPGLPRVIRPTMQYSGKFVSHQSNPITGKNGVQHEKGCVCRPCRTNAIEVIVEVNDLEEIIGPNKSTGWTKRPLLQAAEMSFSDIELLEKRAEFVNGNGQRASLKAAAAAKRAKKCARLAKANFSDSEVFVSEGWSAKEGFKNGVYPIDSFLSGLVMPEWTPRQLNELQRAAAQFPDVVAVNNLKKAGLDYLAYEELYGPQGSELLKERKRYKKIKKLGKSQKAERLAKKMNQKKAILLNKAEHVNQWQAELWEIVKDLTTFEGEAFTKEMLSVRPDEDGNCNLDKSKRFLPYFRARWSLACQFAGIKAYNIEKDTVNTLVNKSNLGIFTVEDSPLGGQVMTKYGTEGLVKDEVRTDIVKHKMPSVGVLKTVKPLMIGGIEVSVRNEEALKAEVEKACVPVMEAELSLAKLQKSLARCRKQSSKDLKQNLIEGLEEELKELREKSKARQKAVSRISDIIPVWEDILRYMFGGRPTTWDPTGFHVKLEAACASVLNTEAYDDKSEYMQDLHLEACTRLQLCQSLASRGQGFQDILEACESRLESALVAAKEDQEDKEGFFEEEFPRLGFTEKPLVKKCPDSGEAFGDFEDLYKFAEDPDKLSKLFHFLTNNEDPWYTCGVSYGGGVNSTEGETESREDMEEAADRSEFDHNRNDDHYSDLLVTWILERMGKLVAYVEKWQKDGKDEGYPSNKVELPWTNGINGFQQFCHQQGVDLYGERHNGAHVTQTNIVWQETRELVKVESRKRLPADENGYRESIPAKFETVTKCTYVVDSSGDTHGSDGKAFAGENKAKMFDVRVKLDSIFKTVWDNCKEQVRGPRNESQPVFTDAHQKQMVRFEAKGYSEGLWSC